MTLTFRYHIRSNPVALRPDSLNAALKRESKDNRRQQCVKDKRSDVNANAMLSENVVYLRLLALPMYPTPNMNPVQCVAMYI